MTKTTTTVYGWSTDSDSSVGIYDSSTICCLSSMSHLHEYCTLVQIQMDMQTFMFHTTYFTAEHLHLFSSGVKAVCLRLCQSIIRVLLTVSRLRRLKPPRPIKNPLAQWRRESHRRADSLLMSSVPFTEANNTN